MTPPTPILIPVEKIHPNVWNPNSMRPEVFDALVQDLASHGFLGPILVRNCACTNVPGDHFEIIDGEHRWLACQDRRVNLAEVPCYVVERDDVAARIETVTRNREHGEFVREKLVRLIDELKGTYRISEDDIRGRLRMPVAEFTLILRPVEMRVEPVKRMVLHGRRRLYTLHVPLASKEQFDLVTDVLGQIMDAAQCDRAYALVRVFEAYRSTQPELRAGGPD